MRRRARPRRLGPAAVAVVLGLALAACAHSRGPEGEAGASDGDPLEPVNRGTFGLNEALDGWLLEPAARGWNFVAPERVQTSLSNFHSNLKFPQVFVNDLFQGKPEDALVEAGRFLTNTTVGVAGLFDPATDWHMPRQDEDFGQTLGVWGVGPGPYLVLPLLGPSSVRDLVGDVVDTPLGILRWFVGSTVTLPLRALQAVNSRASVLDVVEENRRAAIDYYVFVRDAYLAHRASEVRDGALPEQSDEELYFPDAAEPAP